MIAFRIVDVITCYVMTTAWQHHTIMTITNCGYMIQLHCLTLTVIPTFNRINRTCLWHGYIRVITEGSGTCHCVFLLHEVDIILIVSHASELQLWEWYWYCFSWKHRINPALAWWMDNIVSDEISVLKHLKHHFVTFVQINKTLFVFM